MIDFQFEKPPQQQPKSSKNTTLEPRDPIFAYTDVRYRKEKILENQLKISKNKDKEYIQKIRPKGHLLIISDSQLKHLCQKYNKNDFFKEYETVRVIAIPGLALNQDPYEKNLLRWITNKRKQGWCADKFDGILFFGVGGNDLSENIFYNRMTMPVYNLIKDLRDVSDEFKLLFPNAMQYWFGQPPRSDISTKKLRQYNDELKKFTEKRSRFMKFKEFDSDKVKMSRNSPVHVSKDCEYTKKVIMNVVKQVTL